MPRVRECGTRVRLVVRLFWCGVCVLVVSAVGAALREEGTAKYYVHHAPGLKQMSAPVVEAVTPRCVLGEGPHWDDAAQALYYVGIFDKAVFKHTPASGDTERADLYGMPTFIIPVEGKPGHFVVGIGRRLVLLHWTSGPAQVLRTLAEVDQESPNNRFNDAKCDPRGRLFAGTMGHEYEPGKFLLKKGSLYRFDAKGAPTKVASDIDISNGLCWDERRGAFYYADSFEYAIRRYDWDAATGDISNPRLIFKFSEHGLEGIADGMTIDTDGNLWVANFDGSQLVQIDPEASAVLQRVPIPALQTTSCTFGGPRRDQLYVTSAAMDRGAPQPPPAGSTFLVTGLGVAGHRNQPARIDV